MSKTFQATKVAALDSIYKLGQSIWYDNLSRDVLNSGELKKLIDSGVTGLTSNPTIFKKAIADSKDYDSEISTLCASGVKSADQLTESLMVADVASAADLLKPIYQATTGIDGYASIEVSPELANDTKGTIEAAKRLWSRLSRPNVMIKIPATKEGIPAIEEALALGINVNVTLIFSVSSYTQVVEAYLKALEKRSSDSKPIDNIASVASFFVSRVDAIVEKGFSKEQPKAEEKALIGRIGIANSILAYKKFKNIISSDRFQTLQKKGARLQRPLWASTGVKNLALDPLLYVEKLVAKDTVNTLPPATLKHLIESKKIFKDTLADKDYLIADGILVELRRLGHNFDEMLSILLEEGVKLFADSYRELILAVRDKVCNIG
jgi:transaldolase